ncbi:MAG: S-methyl-5-thioribose-1-phosphate isomerase [Methylococcaceae bacterium]
MTALSLTPVQALQWTGTSLKVLDQRKLPDSIIYDEYSDAQGVYEAIATMRVRGAPAIGIAAAYGVVLSAFQHHAANAQTWQHEVLKDIDYLAQSRPTAVNLCWALQKMTAVMQQNPSDALATLEAAAIQIHQDDIAANHKMGELGANIITGSLAVMTHCNTGSLATGGHGTALGVIRSAYHRHPLTVYAGETRPWLQGARLTVWELAQDGIPATLIADSAAAWLMKTANIGWIIVGADRIAANGDTANKIGTYSLAVLAKQHGVKVMVVAPTSTIDWTLANGDNIVIEQRNKQELLPASYHYEGSLVDAWNPVFDVTPAPLIDAIVTERGVVFNPTTQAMKSIYEA